MGNKPTFGIARRKGSAPGPAATAERQCVVPQVGAPECRAGSPRPLLTLRAAFILLVALLTAGAAGVLTYLASASLPAAFLAAGPACAAAITLLNAIIGDQ